MNVLFKQYTNNFYGSISTPISSPTSLTQLWFNCGLLTAHCCGVCAGAYVSLQLHITIINCFPFRYIFIQSLSIRSWLIRNIEFVCPSIHRQFVCFFLERKITKLIVILLNYHGLLLKAGQHEKQPSHQPNNNGDQPQPTYNNKNWLKICLNCRL